MKQKLWFGLVLVLIFSAVAQATLMYIQSTDGKIRLRVPAGWAVAQVNDVSFVVANSSDALAKGAKEDLAAFEADDFAVSMQVASTKSFGIAANTATPEAIEKVFMIMLSSPEATAYLKSIDTQAKPASPMRIGNRIFAGIELSGKMNGFYLANELRPGIFVTASLIVQGESNSKLEQSALSIAASLSYSGTVENLEEE